MMGARLFNAEPRDVERVETKFRKIVTKLPVPESLEVLKELEEYEPRSMRGQPPIVWDKARGVSVYDAYGNMWLDFSSGVLVANAGHGHPKIIKAVEDQLAAGLLHNYCFPSAIRAKLAHRLVELLPDSIGKTFLLTTGAESTECAIKLCRTYGVQKHGKKKINIVTFENAFHGRTMGSQLAGGSPALKEWIVKTDLGFVQAPFPDGFRVEDTSFGFFLKSLEEQGIGPDDIAGVMSETYQGGGASFLPVEFAKQLREWCTEHDIILVFDEVQAGFGRTGTMWGFEHYGVVPDLVCMGKGISSSLPLSAVGGRDDLMDLHGPRQMTSTHSGNPVCAAAALASIDAIVEENMVENARRMGELMFKKLGDLQNKFPDRIGAVHGKGLVAGIQCVVAGSKGPDADIAFSVVQRCFEKGLLMFAPVGLGGGSVKIAPPLSITADAIEEGCDVLANAFDAVLGN